MNEDFVPFELAVKLKEKGFREKCLLHYESTGGFYSNSIDTYDRPNQELDYSDFLKCFNEGNSIGLIDAPTISQVLKWFRKKKIVVSILPTGYNKETEATSYYYVIYDVAEYFWKKYEYPQSYETWEECGLSAIKYVLDNLI